MRNSALIVAAGMVFGALATVSAAGGPPVFLNADGTIASGTYTPHAVVRLDTMAALDALRTANPRHYAIARKILAAANEICEAEPGKIISTKYNAQYVGCLGSLWLESNPPKHQLSFSIDDIPYSALVEVQLKVKVTPSDPAWAVPILRQPGK